MRANIHQPPKGWNSFDSYGWSVTETEFQEGVAYCDKNLKAYGYNVMTVDFCWSHPGANSLPNPNLSQTHATLVMDDYGRLLPAEDRFPSAKNGAGFRPLADFVHGKGMKFGIHLMRGIPKQAVEQNTPILNSPYTARDAADTQALHCWWLDHMHPLNMEHPAAQAYLESLFALYADWAVDFVKVDDLSFPYSDKEVEGYSTAIAHCGREIILSLSPGATPVEKWEHVSRYADMWRISPDFWDSFDALKKSFSLFDAWSAHRVENTYPDGDMIPFGQLSLRGPSGEPRFSSFTQAEKEALMAMWCINGSPLILGGRLQDMDTPTLRLLQDPLLLQMDNSACNAHKVLEQDGLLLWQAEDRYNPAVRYLALFNLTDDAVLTPEIALAQIKSGAAQVLAQGSRCFVPGKTIQPVLYPHGAAVFMIR